MAVYQKVALKPKEPAEAKERFFNCHAHCFTMGHVPDFFFSRLMPVTRLLHKRWVKKLVQNGPLTGKMPIPLRILLFFLGLVNLLTIKMFLRLLTMVRYGNADEQLKVIEAMRQYYPRDTGIVFLTMDMEYMGAGKPVKPFEEQLKELAALKNTVEYRDVIYPFIFVDPRRAAPANQKERDTSASFTGKDFLETTEKYLREGSFQGLKIYPALGYYPFDKRMKPFYDMALEHNIPITTHCTTGVVHHKKRLPAGERFHPFKGHLPNLRPAKYQVFFSHPLNYLCLMDRELLKQVWGEDAPDYSQMKWCIGHWGSGDDWHRYLENDWADAYMNTRDELTPSLLLKNWHTDPGLAYKNFTWFTIIYELMKCGKYPNLYTDISYTLHDATLLPMLKMMLESHKEVREHVLFGTDFYMTSKVLSERAYSIGIRAALGEELFHQTAVLNARTFLSNKFKQVY